MVPRLGISGPVFRERRFPGLGGESAEWRFPAACDPPVGEFRYLQVGVPGRKIEEADREFIRERVRWMFRADEDFQEFWKLCRGHGILRHCRSNRMGALHRSATIFEDVVKTICTVNCQWRNTKRMVGNLCRMFGERRNRMSPETGEQQRFVRQWPERDGKRFGCGGSVT